LRSFELLQADGDDLRTLALCERRASLNANVTPHAGLQIIQGAETHREAMFAAIAAQDFEGIVANRIRCLL